MTPFTVDSATQLLLERFADPSITAFDRLIAAAGIHQYLDQAMPQLAHVARQEEGHSWADIGVVLQVTRQAAFQRLGKSAGGVGTAPVIDPNSAVYLDSLREVRNAIADEPGRETELALLDSYLDRVEAGMSTDDMTMIPMVLKVNLSGTD
jgi:hypothetical protein